MTIKIICEDISKKAEYIEHIVNKCVWVEGLPMKVILSLDEIEEKFPEIQIQALEEWSEKEKKGMIENQELRIDNDTRQVWLEDEEVKLTRIEFELLSLLIKNRGRVVVKEEFYKKIWDGIKERDKIESSLAVHMKNLRKKIKCDSENPKYIQNIWGVGYRFLLG